VGKNRFRNSSLADPMKMVQGRSLAQVLEELRQQPKQAGKEYTLSRLLSIFVSACHALAYAHSRGVVHRDLKPANIMLGDFGEVYVMDWGLAKVLAVGGNPPTSALASSTRPPKVVATSREPETDLTQDGAILGTPAYMPPEQARGQIQAIDQRSDVYSLGAILYDLLALQPPVEQKGGYLAVLLRVMESNIMLPEKRNPQRARAGLIPRELSAIAMKALAQDPNARYQSVAALRRDVERFLEGRSVSAKDDTRWETLIKFSRRNKGFSAATAVASLVLAVVVGFSLKINHEARLDAEQAQERAETALTNFQTEQVKRQEQARNSVPAFLRAARLAANERQFDDALAQINVAMEYATDPAEVYLLKAKVLILKMDFAAAEVELQRYRLLRPDDSNGLRLSDWCNRVDANDPRTLVPFLEQFLRDNEFAQMAALRPFRTKLQAYYSSRLEQAWPGMGAWRVKVLQDGKLDVNLSQCEAQVTALAPLRGMPLTKLNLHRCTKIKSLKPLTDMPLTDLILRDCVELNDLTPLQQSPITYLDLAGCRRIQNLTPLARIPITHLDLGVCPVSDLGPLRNLPLNWLSLYDCRDVQDLQPLHGLQNLKYLDLTGCLSRDVSALRDLPLTWLTLFRSAVRDLTPLQRLPLKHLDIADTKVDDLTPLADMALEHFLFTPKNIKKGIPVIRRMKSLKVISTNAEDTQFTAEEFWKHDDAGDFKR
jgi:serine/threonine protein kinase